MVILASLSFLNDSKIDSRSRKYSPRNTSLNTMGVINRKQTAVARHLVSREDDGPSITSSSEATINKDKSRNIFQER